MDSFNFKSSFKACLFWEFLIFVVFTALESSTESFKFKSSFKAFLFWEFIFGMSTGFFVSTALENGRHFSHRKSQVHK